MIPDHVSVRVDQYVALWAVAWALRKWQAKLKIVGLEFNSNFDLFGTLEDKLFDMAGIPADNTVETPELQYGEPGKFCRDYWYYDWFDIVAQDDVNKALSFGFWILREGEKFTWRGAN